MNEKPSLMARILAAVRPSLGARSAEGDATGESMNALREQLHKALYNVEPGFSYIQDVFLETSTVVYEVYRDDKYAYFQRTYEKDGDAYKLNDDTQEVAMKMEYKPLTADIIDGTKVLPAPAVLRAAECGCTTKEVLTMSKVKELATRLIASTRFAEEDREILEKFPEARLEALVGCLDAEIIAAKVIEPVIVTVKTEAEWLAEAPADVRSLVETARARDKAVRDSLIKSLGEGQKVYTVAQLTTKTTDDLRQLAEVLKIQAATVDFAGLATTPPDAPTSPTPPRGYSLALAKQRGTDVVQKAN